MCNLQKSPFQSCYFQHKRFEVESNDSYYQSDKAILNSRVIPDLPGKFHTDRGVTLVTYFSVNLLIITLHIDNYQLYNQRGTNFVSGSSLLLLLKWESFTSDSTMKINRPQKTLHIFAIINPFANTTGHDSRQS